MRTLIILIITMTVTLTSFAQGNSFNLVFDVTSSQEKTHQTTVRHLNFMTKNSPQSKLDIVVYSGSIKMVLKNESSVAKEIETLSENENITFKVCSTTMQRAGIDESMLIEGVQVVQNPLFEIFSRQQEGWGYIKETNN